MALLKLSQYIIRNSLVTSGTIFDSKTINNLKFNLAFFYLVLEQELNDSL